MTNKEEAQAIPERTPDPVHAADHLAVGLARARFLLVLPLARAAADFIRGCDWLGFGYARLEDHARERFGRSGRWLRDLRSLHEAMSRCPALAQALTGDDGGAPLGTVAALLIGKVATPETCEEWIERARRITVRELREQVLSGDAIEEPEGSDLVTLCVASPPAIGVAVEEARDLHRAVCGGEASTSEFVEALVADAFSGPVEPLIPDGAACHRPPEGARERALERKAEGWAFLRAAPLDEEGLRDAQRVLEETSRRCRVVTNRSCTADSTIRALIHLENEIELRIGDLLALMAETGAWRGLRFSGVGHYAEERLGMSRSVAQARCRLSRLFRARRRLRAACEEGRVSLEAASLVARIDGELEAAWIERAEESTIKRLREELRIIDRDRVLHPEVSAAAPIDDETWHRWRGRRAGQTIERLELLTMSACAGPVATARIRFRLSPDLASMLRSAIDAERERLNGICREPWLAEDPENAAIPGSIRAALMFSTSCHGVPEWCALLALIEEFVRTWDDPRQSPRRAADEIYIRDGWRCSAPGCTSRRNLEEHHIVYHSRGGGESPTNRVTLCRFHHQRGEHGGLMRCRGRAPLGILWSMGTQGVGGLYRNERRIRLRRLRRGRTVLAPKLATFVGGAVVPFDRDGAVA